MDYKKLAYRIRECRAKLGYSQKELAEAIGVSQPIISRIESGNRGPTFDIFIKLSNTLSCTPNELLQDYVNIQDDSYRYTYVKCLMEKIPENDIEKVEAILKTFTK